MRKLSIAVLALLSLALAHVPARAQFYTQTNLITDDQSANAAALTNTKVVNAWGLAASGGSPWWLANNGTDSSTLYNAVTGTIPPLQVSIPGGAPTGIVFNSAGANTFVVSNGAASASSVFIFASEAGIISGWNPGVPPPPQSTQAQIGTTVAGAIYKGLAIAGTGTDARLYASNFSAGTVDVFDSTFTLLVNPAAFVDPALPAGYAPFGIQNIGGTIYVTYALQDEEHEDEIAGPGLGYVDAYDTAGNLLRRVVSGGALNAPWGLALAPADFGQFSGMLLVGNFGNGRINGYDISGSGEAVDAGPLHSAKGPPLRIDGLWAIAFGNGGNAGPKNTLYFTAGPDEESHGLFGSLEVAGPPGHNKQ